MQHPSIIVRGYAEAAMCLRSAGGAEIGAIITIAGQHEFPLEAPSIARQLHLRFDDVDAPIPNDSESAYRSWVQEKWAREVGRSFTPPTIEDARVVIEFARDIQSIPGAVLCSCQGGISRSAAAALLCLATWRGAGEEEQCVQELLKVRPSAAPHLGLIQFGDALLGCAGYLVSAVRSARLRGS
jgi:predicted protein tyrosine phosphatase